MWAAICVSPHLLARNTRLSLLLAPPLTRRPPRLSFGIIWRCLREKRMHARTQRSHGPKPKPGAICTVNWRRREPFRMSTTSRHRRLRRTPNASTRTFAHSSARSNCRDAAREANCTSTASSVSDLLTAVSLPCNQPPRPPYARENSSSPVVISKSEDKANMIR